MTNNLDKIKAMDLINQALTEPGQALAAYRAFHRFSLNNSMLAMYQLAARGIEISPIKTFKQWQEYGRSVKKGEKAIALLMPMLIDIKKEDEKTGETKIIGQRKIFISKNYWFALSQTKEYKADKKNTNKKLENDVLEWNVKTALKTLKIKQIKFNSVNGNAQGYANKNGIAINPLAAFPIKTAIHEIAHKILGHVEEIESNAIMDRSIMEAEAEMTNYLVMASLGLDGLEHARDYIQNWLSGQKFPETSAQKCITAANKILDAGKIEKKAEKKARKAA